MRAWHAAAAALLRRRANARKPWLRAARLLTRLLARAAPQSSCSFAASWASCSRRRASRPSLGRSSPVRARAPKCCFQRRAGTQLPPGRTRCRRRRARGVACSMPAAWACVRALRRPLRSAAPQPPRRFRGCVALNGGLWVPPHTLPLPPAPHANVRSRATAGILLGPSGLGQSHPCPSGSTANGAACDLANPTLILFPTYTPFHNGPSNIRNYLNLCAQARARRPAHAPRTRCV
jgi:hypothetical protein